MSPCLRLSPATRTAAGWLAALAMLMLALAPALTRALASVDTASWVPVCTADGLVQVQLLEDGQRIPNPAEHVAQAECPYCALQAQVQVLPSSPLRLALPLRADGAAPPPAGALHRGASPWPPAQARAPPQA